MKDKERKLQLISVQSRKGGVGKTTVAYNVARTYLKKGNNVVLVMDLDFFGTDITVSTSFEEWFDDRFCVQEKRLRDKRVEEKRFEDGPLKRELSKAEDNEDAINLLELYTKHYNDDYRLLSFSEVNEAIEGNTLLVNSKRVNLIGSSSHYKDNDDNEIDQNPSVLFDPIVGYHFIRFIFDLVQRFYGYCIKSNKDAIVVFDNSPGHIGFVPMLEDFLLDFGPDISKYIFVCTNNESDIEESFTDISQLHEKLQNRISVMKKDDTMGLTEYHKSFTRRIYEYKSSYMEYLKDNSSNSDNIDMLRLKYYKTISENDTVLPHHYIGLIFNKMLPEIVIGEHSFDVYDIIDKHNIVQKLIYRKKNKFPTGEMRNIYVKNLMITKSELYEWSYLKKQTIKTTVKEPHKFVKFSTAKHSYEADMIKQFIENDPYECYSKSLYALCRTARRYNVVIQRMNSKKLGFLARIIPSEWSLSSAFDRFVELITDLDNMVLDEQWTMGDDTPFTTKKIKNEINSSLPYIINKNDTFMIYTYKLLYMIFSEKYKPDPAQTERLTKRYSEYNAIFEEMGKMISETDLGDRFHYEEIVEDIITKKKMGGIRVGNELEMIENAKKLAMIVIRVMFSEVYLSKYLELIYSILLRFKTGKKIKDPIKLLLSPQYINIGNKFFVEQSISSEEFDEELSNLKETPSGTILMTEFASVIKKVSDGWNG